MSRKYPFYRQYDRMDCGPTCIRMISKFYGKSFDGAYLRELTSLRGDGASILTSPQETKAVRFS